VKRLELERAGLREMDGGRRCAVDSKAAASNFCDAVQCDRSEFLSGTDHRSGQKPSNRTFYPLKNVDTPGSDLEERDVAGQNFLKDLARK
jgi:hypothetical protein